MFARIATCICTLARRIATCICTLRYENSYLYLHASYMYKNSYLHLYATLRYYDLYLASRMSSPWLLQAKAVSLYTSSSLGLHSCRLEELAMPSAKLLAVLASTLESHALFIRK